MRERRRDIRSSKEQGRAGNIQLQVIVVKCTGFTHGQAGNIDDAGPYQDEQWLPPLVLAVLIPMDTNRDGEEYAKDDRSDLVGSVEPVASLGLVDRQLSACC